MGPKDATAQALVGTSAVFARADVRGRVGNRGVWIAA